MVGVEAALTAGLAAEADSTVVAEAALTAGLAAEADSTVVAEAAFTAGLGVAADSAVGAAFAAGLVVADSAVEVAFAAGLVVEADSAVGVAFAAGLAAEASTEGLEAFTEAGVGMADSVITAAAGSETVSALDLVTGPGSIGADRIMAITDIPIIPMTGVILTVLTPATRMVTARMITARMPTVRI